jgi:hypothetical protein
MPDTPIPWVGLAALAAMFLLPLLPDWLLRGRGRSSTGRAGMCAATATPPGPTSTPAPWPNASLVRGCGARSTGSGRRPNWNPARSAGSRGRDARQIVRPGRVAPSGCSREASRGRVVWCRVGKATRPVACRPAPAR